MSAALVTATVHIAADHPAFVGHFPGRPLLPGVSILAEVMEALGDASGAANGVRQSVTINAAKFLAPVGPGSLLHIVLDAEDALAGRRFVVSCGDLTVASGRLSFEPAAGAAASDERAR